MRAHGAGERALLGKAACQRLDLACTLLAEGSRPIAEVALACGFSEQSALTRAMRTHLDTTPAAYRRSRQELASTKQ